MTNRKKKLTMKHKNNILKAYHDIIRRPTVKMRNSKMRLDMNALCHYKHY